MAEPASPSRETAIGKSTTSYHEPGPTELLLATPVPILHLIARLGPTIHVLTGLVQTLTWQHPTSHSVASYLMLLGWWAVCLFGETAITYGTNALGLLLLVVGYATHRKGRRSVAAPADDPSRPPRMDSTRLARAIDAARELEAALKKLRAEFQPMLDTLAWRDVDAAQEAAALLLTSYPFALVAGYYLPTRYIVAVLGSVVLAWHAPWFKVLRRALGRSLLLRFFGRLSLGILGGGRGLLREARRGRSAVRLFANARGQTKADGRPLAGSRRSSTHGPSGDSSSDEVVFLFTILEHQRWWIGLGFGPALLPNERPSWSDVHLAPVSPPSAFLLPAPQTTYTPAPTSKNPEAQLKRTTDWRWLDDNWTIKLATPEARRRSDEAAAKEQGTLSRMLSGSPSTHARRQSDASSTTSPTRASTSNLPPAIVEEGDEAPAIGLGGDDDELGPDWDVDNEGWQYSDNTWQRAGRAPKMGRFTRRRAWQRRAVAAEHIETVSGPAKTPTATPKKSTVVPDAGAASPRRASAPSSVKPKLA